MHSDPLRENIFRMSLNYEKYNRVMNQSLTKNDYIINYLLLISLFISRAHNQSVPILIKATTRLSLHPH